MSIEQPAGNSSSNVGKIIVTILIALVVVCIVIPICVIAILAITGPQIANIFSRVTNGMSGTIF